MFGRLAVCLHPLNRGVAERERMFDELRFERPRERSYRPADAEAGSASFQAAEQALGRVEPVGSPRGARWSSGGRGECGSAAPTVP